MEAQNIRNYDLFHSLFEGVVSSRQNICFLEVLNLTLCYPIHSSSWRSECDTPNIFMRDSFAMMQELHNIYYMFLSTSALVLPIQYLFIRLISSQIASSLKVVRV